jgi:hypothetical protein
MSIDNEKNIPVDVFRSYWPPSISPNFLTNFDGVRKYQRKQFTEKRKHGEMPTIYLQSEHSPLYLSQNPEEFLDSVLATAKEILGENFGRFIEIAKNPLEYEKNPEMAKQYFEWVKQIYDTLLAKGYIIYDLNR